VDIAKIAQRRRDTDAIHESSSRGGQAFPNSRKSAISVTALTSAQLGQI